MNPKPASAARSRSEQEGERKLVTVLFTDIVGSTSLAEQLDPEDWAEIVAGMHKRVSEAVTRYDGLIAQLLGDGALAFFGAPVAHEDDPERAVHAALGILASIKEYARELRAAGRAPNFQMRVGLNTGLVVVGNIGAGKHIEYLAVGDTVNLAARMQSAAQPDSILIAENTARAARHAFELESLGMLEVKGKSGPVAAYRVVGPKSVVESKRGIVGLNSPIVGREREIDLLRERIDDLVQGRGSIVSVMGDAGLGKSRLVTEVVQRAPQDFARYEGRSLSFTASVPYTPFVELLTRWFNLQADETDAEKYARIGDPFIAALLGVQPQGEDADQVRFLEPPQLRGHIFASVVGLIEQVAREKPLALIFEDLHWADSTSLDLLEQLMSVAAHAPLMLVGAFRPQREEPSWRFHEVASRDHPANYASILLEPLDESNSRVLVANLLHIEDLPEKVRGLILRKADGNPFYVEEVIRSLLDAKLVVRQDDHWRATKEIENIALPDTLAGVITARLDRLDGDAKRTAQTAAVIGREFPFDVLADVYEAPQTLGESLDRLQTRELIREKSRLPQLAYLFKHALTQEASYNSLLMSKRRAIHRQVAECLEKVDTDHVSDIAQHFLSAQEPARALPYLLTAADRAARNYSTPEAIMLYSRAVEIAQNLDDVAATRRAYEGLGGALSLTDDVQRALDTYRAMEQFAVAHDDAPMRVSALNKIAQIVSMRLGDFEQATACLINSEVLARSNNDKAGLGEHIAVRCSMFMAAADFENMVKYMNEGFEIGHELQANESMAFFLAHTANALTYMTRYDEGWAKAQEAYALAKDIGDLVHLAEVQAVPMTLYHWRNGDLDAAIQSSERSLKLATKIGLSYFEATAALLLGMMAHQRGEYERAIAMFERGIAVGNAAGFPFIAAMGLSWLGIAYSDISPAYLPRTLEMHQQAAAFLENPFGMMGGGLAWGPLGDCALAIGSLDKARDFYGKGLNVPTPHMHIQRPHFLLGQAQIALVQHELDEAERLVDEARAFAQARGMQHFYPFIAYADGQVSATRGDDERALAQFARAEELGLLMKLRPLVWHSRACAADALFRLGRTAEAEAKRREAQVMVNEIASLFQNAELRDAFLANAQQEVAM